MKVITIGRAPDNDIVIDDPEVSRNHLQLIQKDNGMVSVVDLGSANGTYVNGKKIKGEVVLSKGAIVMIGHTVLPWRKYFRTKCKKSVVVMILVPLLTIIVVGAVVVGIAFVRSHNMEPESRLNEWQLDSIKIDSLQKEADELYNKALETQSKEDREKAEQKQKEAEEAKRMAEKAVRERDDAVSLAQDANIAYREAMNKAAEAEKARLMAEKVTEAAELDRDSAEHKAAVAEQARYVAEKKAAEANALLEDVLNDNYARILEGLKNNKKKLESVVERLGQSVDTLSDYVDFIDSEYRKGDITRKREIIDIMQKIAGSGNTNRDDAVDSIKTNHDEN